MVPPGSIIGERYRVGRVLGRGGMGVIVEATHLQLGTPVAIKILRDDYAAIPVVVERFLREARAAAQLRGEHVCRVQDFGTLESGAPYMVMELLEGRDLSVVLTHTGTVPVDLAVVYVMQACAAVAEPHALGFVHRDLKPGNLFLTQRPDGSPSIKVVDFGIAKSIVPVDFNLTDASNVMGSPAYMAPEQLRSNKHVDLRSDIWSLGVVLYELITGEQPFTGESLTDLALAITTQPPMPLPLTLDPDLTVVVMRCLEKQPADRFADVGALAAALAPFASTSASALADSVARVLAAPPREPRTLADSVDADSVDAPEPVLPPQPHSVTTLASATGSVIPGTEPRRRWLLAAGVTAVILAAAVAVVWVQRRGAREDEPDGDRRPASAPADAAAATLAPDPAPEPVAVDPPPDAALTADPDPAAIDAGLDLATGDPPDAATDPAPRTKRRPTKPRKPPKDLGESRF